MELASVYNRLGTKVIVVEMLDRAAPGMDLAIHDCAIAQKGGDGILFKLSGEKRQKNATVTLEILQNNQKTSLSSEKVLVAIGRRPYAAGLGLQEIGIKLNPKGFVEVDSRFKIFLPHICAIGDVIEGPMLAHKASEEGAAAAEIIAGGNPKINYLAIPNVIYTQPEAASVGLTEQEVKEAGLDFVSGTSFFSEPAGALSRQYRRFCKNIGRVPLRQVIRYAYIRSTCF